ncbi:MAG: hypothetical protein ACRDB0_08660 [Paraclostridium sp.]
MLFVKFQIAERETTEDEIEIQGVTEEEDDTFTILTSEDDIFTLPARLFNGNITKFTDSLPMRVSVQHVNRRITCISALS